MTDAERDTMRECPKCDGAGVMSESRGTTYFVGSCDLCDSLGAVPGETYRAYVAQQRERRGES